MFLKLSDVRALVCEALEENVWVVRAGQNVLTRESSSSPRDWKWYVTQKVNTFYDDEIVMGPKNPNEEQVWVFERDGHMIAVREDQFFTKPAWKHRRRF